MSFTREHEGAQATDFAALADWTDETAEANPDWKLDLSDQELATWRGTQSRRGEITLVWGVALTANGVVATSELGPTTTDQCAIIEDRFTLVSLDNYTGDYIEIKLWGAGGGEVEVHACARRPNFGLTQVSKHGRAAWAAGARMTDARHTTSLAHPQL